MRHIEIRDLWLQKEVLKGAVKVIKIPGESNPADLMTKYLGADVIGQRLKSMNLRRVSGHPIKRQGPKDNAIQIIGAEKKRWADEDEGKEEEAENEACRKVVEWWLKNVSRKSMFEVWCFTAKCGIHCGRGG